MDTKKASTNSIHSFEAIFARSKLWLNFKFKLFFFFIGKKKFHDYSVLTPINIKQIRVAWLRVYFKSSRTFQNLWVSKWSQQNNIITESFAPTEYAAYPTVFYNKMESRGNRTYLNRFPNYGIVESQSKLIEFLILRKFVDRA